MITIKKFIFAIFLFYLYNIEEMPRTREVNKFFFKES